MNDTTTIPVQDEDVLAGINAELDMLANDEQLRQAEEEALAILHDADA